MVLVLVVLLSFVVYTYSGRYEVKFYMRGENYEAVKENGLRLIVEYIYIIIIIIVFIYIKKRNKKKQTEHPPPPPKKGRAKQYLRHL